MDTLLIIGNGFDLAHGLPTSYKHFIEAFINKLAANPHDFPELITPYAETLDSEGFKTYLDNHLYKNKFLKLLISDYSEKNWCDIEDLYFKELTSMKNSTHIQSLNKDFSRIKYELETYLSNLNWKPPGHSYFKRILKPEDFTDKLTILNFNYTDYYTDYVELGRTQVINIHGSLGSKDNPMIFGYAATEAQIKEYREFDNEYMRNIKRTNYKFSGKYDDLLEVMETDFQYGLRVFILGHSCGPSDRLILSQIFNNPKVKWIEIAYFNKEAFFNQVVNIENLLEQEEYFNKIVPFNRSLRMPQIGEGENYEQTLSSFFENRRR